ncbi:MAG TPA: DoxX family protein [Cyclobacteriaceae bacterium]|nr:DoxX family protein [Cyclobacteriaceae bacterium]
MKIQDAIKIFLRLSLAAGFLSAVADRLGIWSKEVSAWGNWENFLKYTATINPWMPDALIPAIGFIATAAEVLFAVCLLVGFKTEWVARLSGVLLLLFAVSMTLATGVKGPLDYSVYSAAAAAFALSTLQAKYLEVDVYFSGK